MAGTLGTTTKKMDESRMPKGAVDFSPPSSLLLSSLYVVSCSPLLLSCVEDSSTFSCLIHCLLSLLLPENARETQASGNIYSVTFSLCFQQRPMALFLVTFGRKNPMCILWLKVKTESISLPSPSPNPAAVESAVLLSQFKRAAAYSGEGQNKQTSGEEWLDEKWRIRTTCLKREYDTPHDDQGTYIMAVTTCSITYGLGDLVSFPKSLCAGCVICRAGAAWQKRSMCIFDGGEVL